MYYALRMAVYMSVAVLWGCQNNATQETNLSMQHPDSFSWVTTITKDTTFTIKKKFIDWHLGPEYKLLMLDKNDYYHREETIEWYQSRLELCAKVCKNSKEEMANMIEEAQRSISGGGKWVTNSEIMDALLLHYLLDDGIAECSTIFLQMVVSMATKKR